jgi:hypothetical protein
MREDNCVNDVAGGRGGGRSHRYLPAACGRIRVGDESALIPSGKGRACSDRVDTAIVRLGVIFTTSWRALNPAKPCEHEAEVETDPLRVRS